MKRLLCIAILSLAAAAGDAQCITSGAVIVFAGTDSSAALSQTMTICVNDESGTVQFIHSDGSRTYLIDSISYRDTARQYFLVGPIYCYEIRHEFLLVYYRDAPDQPMYLVNLNDPDPLKKQHR